MRTPSPAEERVVLSVSLALIRLLHPSAVHRLGTFVRHWPMSAARKRAPARPSVQGKVAPSTSPPACFWPTRPAGSMPLLCSPRPYRCGGRIVRTTCSTHGTHAVSNNVAWASISFVSSVQHDCISILRKNLSYSRCAMSTGCLSAKSHNRQKIHLTCACRLLCFYNFILELPICWMHV